jgi:uncharacterized protein YydD (DUF2326 family)
MLAAEVNGFGGLHLHKNEITEGSPVENGKNSSHIRCFDTLFLLIECLKKPHFVILEMKIVT